MAQVLASVLVVRGIDGVFRASIENIDAYQISTFVLEMITSVLLFIGSWSSYACFALVLLGVLYARNAKDATRQQKACAFFKDKTVWVTGASSGIGEALAKELYNAGARVILSGRRKEELERVSSECVSEGRNLPNAKTPIILPLDLSEPKDMALKVEELRRTLSTLDANARVDVLINNAGVSSRALAAETGWLVDQEMMAINYLGPVALTKAVLAWMLQGGGGSVVVVSSVQGLVGLPARSAYSAAKHALHGFFDSLRAEVASRGVFVTVVCPGYVRTELSRNARTGGGQPYGRMDETTARGMPPALVAKRILQAAAAREAQVLVTRDLDARVAPLLRLAAPSLLAWAMRRRAARA